MFDVAGASQVVIENQISMSSQCVSGPIAEASLSLLSCFLPIATDSSAKSNSHSYISNFIIIEQLSMRNNHNMWQRHMAAQIIISGMFCMTKHQHTAGQRQSLSLTND